MGAVVYNCSLAGTLGFSLVSFRNKTAQVFCPPVGTCKSACRRKRGRISGVTKAALVSKQPAPCASLRPKQFDVATHSGLKVNHFGCLKPLLSKGKGEAAKMLCLAER